VVVCRPRSASCVRTLGADAITTSEAGYALTIGSGDVDVIRFEQLVAKGRRLAEDGEPALASAALGEALGLRRGEPLAEFAYAGFADAERARLDELAVVAVEARAGSILFSRCPSQAAAWVPATTWRRTSTACRSLTGVS
jgi:two-component SAPR family response regulator